MNTTNFSPSMSTPAAQAYADQVLALGKHSPVDALETISYGSDPAQKFQVYAPTSAQGLPVLIFLHGGAWTHGDLNWLRFMAPAVLAMPAVLIAVSYRLAPKHRWPAAYHDVDLALQAIHTYIHKTPFDQQRVIAGGHSAGGHLVSLAILAGRHPWVKACFPVSSRFSLHSANPAPGSGEERVYKLVLASPDQDYEASPLNYVKGSCTPFHIVWGENDFERVATTSAQMVQALRKENIPVSHRIIPGASHFDTHLQLGDAENEWYRRLQKGFDVC